METTEKLEKTTDLTTLEESSLLESRILHSAKPVVDYLSNQNSGLLSAMNQPVTSYVGRGDDDIYGKGQMPLPQMTHQRSSEGRMDMTMMPPPIPSFHDMRTSSGSGGNGTLQNSHNLLSDSANNGVRVTQFTNDPPLFNGIGVTSGSEHSASHYHHHQSFQSAGGGSSANIGAGVGISHHLSDMQSSLLLSSQQQQQHSLGWSDLQGGTDAMFGMMKESNMQRSNSAGSLSYGQGNMAQNILPINPMTAVTMTQNQQQQQQQQQQRVHSQQLGGQSGVSLQQHHPPLSSQQLSQQGQYYLSQGQYSNTGGSSNGSANGMVSGNYLSSSLPNQLNPNLNQLNPNPKKGQQAVARPWHTPEHAAERVEMNKRIVSLLEQRRPNATNEWYQKLPQMAKRLEEALYGEALSFEMYNDFTTLKGRLQQLALSMSGSNPNAKKGTSSSVGGAVSGGGGGGQQQNVVDMSQQQLLNLKQQQLQHLQLIQSQQSAQQQAGRQQQQAAGANYQSQPPQSQPQPRNYPPGANVNPKSVQQPPQSMQPVYTQIPQATSHQQQQPAIFQQHPMYAHQNGVQPMVIATDNTGVNSAGLSQAHNFHPSVLPNMLPPSSVGNPTTGSAGPRFVNMNNVNPVLYSNTVTPATQPPVIVPVTQEKLTKGRGTKETAKDGKEDKVKKETKPRGSKGGAAARGNSKGVAEEKTAGGGLVDGKAEALPEANKVSAEGKPTGRKGGNKRPPPSATTSSEDEPPTKVAKPRKPKSDVAEAKRPTSSSVLDKISTLSDEEKRAALERANQTALAAATANFKNKSLKAAADNLKAENGMPPPKASNQRTAGDSKTSNQKSGSESKMANQKIPTVAAPQIKKNGNDSKDEMGAAGGVGGSGVSHTEDHRRAVLKQQIQRLLLLRHASKCPHEGNKCPVTTHCSSMKNLWKHLMKCKDQECKVAHCVSSRYVLSHYSKCQDSHCPVCGPVRATIKRASNDNLEIANNMTSHAPPPVQPTPSAEPSASVLSSSASSTVTGSTNVQNPHTIPDSKKPRIEEPVVQEPVGPQPPDNVSSAIYNFTDDQIKLHMAHLIRMKALDIRNNCLPLVDDMIRHPNGYIFATPVDPVKLMIPDYPDIIKKPMDLGTIRKRLESQYYRDLNECANDIRLTFDNAMLYNPMSTDVHRCARHFKTQFEKSFKLKLEQIEKATDERRLDPDSCILCGEKDLYFELPNYYCNGKCGSRIKKNAVYYSDEKNTLHWCQSCYQDLRDPIKVVGGPNLYKKDLKQNKLLGETEDLREPMVCCDGCSKEGYERWVHYVCGLFNARRNMSKEMQYFCPNCVLQQRAKLPPKTILPEKKMLANTLPHCLMSEYIEKRVLIALEKAYAEDAEKLGVSIDMVDKCAPLSIRQVSCIDNNQPTQAGMKSRYANYPHEFPVRAKCILMFQTIGGQDVILFGMYVYEYGHNCPQPNQRRVYVSYLDSVHYLRPRQYRTPVYHEILIAYLEYVKMRGFHTAHIWACPPMPKDDYIFNAHPPDQKVPKQERLRQWYASMLETCVQRGIVEEISDLHTEYMASETNDASVLPYLDGDYWVGVAEDIIKKLAKDDHVVGDSDSGSVGSDKSKRKNKAAAPKRVGARGRQSRGASGSVCRDIVMSKLAAIIEPMKNDFFVARLHSKEYIDACSRMTEEETDEKKSGDNKVHHDKKLQEEALSSGDYGKVNSKMKRAVSVVKTEPNQQSIGPPTEAKVPHPLPSNTTSTSAALVTATVTVKMEVEDSETSSLSESKNSTDSGSTDVTQNLPILEEKDSSSSMEVDVNPPQEQAVTSEVQNIIEEKMEMEEAEAGSSTVQTKDSAVIDVKVEPSLEVIASMQVAIIKPEIVKPEIIPTKDTEDRDDTQECEHFETRLAFLQLCQGNHYQFDQLRRAKHSSMMILYHLHNPDAPKFMAVCSIPTCTQSIVAGRRYHCDTCDVDFCESCYKQRRDTKDQHIHPLRPIQVAGSTSAMHLTEEQRRERNRSIQLHLQLLLHSARDCKGKECVSKNCEKMKEFLKHEPTCTIGIKKGCPHCKKVLNLLNLHARGCREEKCPVPKCMEIREKIRQNQLKQRQMDDRRRQMMNDIYSAQRNQS